MIDFLKAHPGITKEQYLWEWTVPQIKLATLDNTHIQYLTEEQKKIYDLKKNAMISEVNESEKKKSRLNDLGAPLFE